MEIFSFYHEIVCCVYSLEWPLWSNSHEYTQHTVIVWKIEKTFLYYLSPNLALWLTLSGSNYPYLEQMSMVPKIRAIEVWLYFHVRSTYLGNVSILLNSLENAWSVDFIELRYSVSSSFIAYRNYHIYPEHTFIPLQYSIYLEHTFISLQYHIYSKYWDTLTPYHTCPKIWKSLFYFLLMCLK